MNKLIFKLFSLRVFVLLIFSFALAGCGITGKTVSVPHEISDKPELYFCPRQDCGKILEIHIRNASTSVHCAIYDMDLANVIGAIGSKSRSIDVRLVMDDSSGASLKGNVKLDDKRQLMHNKFCVIDKYTVVTGSFNPTSNDNFKNNNNIVVVDSKAIADNFENEFDELWNGKFGAGSKTKYPIVYVNDIKIENYFCP
ncbi:hypothetical protein HYS31_04510, partial [Candidatus Woesearchaeota archaeon]|nr:hypothetical protein [Candidatus Woesearchaeota archaeon]